MDGGEANLHQPFTGHTGRVWSIDWSAGGDLLLTGSDEGTASIWDAHSGAELLSYPLGWVVERYEWAPDMGQIASGQEDGSVRSVDVNWRNREELIAYARGNCLVRELTADLRDLFSLTPR